VTDLADKKADTKNLLIDLAQLGTFGVIGLGGLFWLGAIFAIQAPDVPEGFLIAFWLLTLSLPIACLVHIVLLKPAQVMVRRHNRFKNALALALVANLPIIISLLVYFIAFRLSSPY